MDWCLYDIGLCRERFKYFSVVQSNSLRYKFGIFNSICKVSSLVFEFLNLTDLIIRSDETKVCLSDNKSFIT